jgi:hypothetical protein
MADYSPTIIAASLNDNELKTAIDKLVKYVDDGALKMAENFNAGVQLMRESLNSIGKSNVTNGIFSQAKAHNEVSKALEKEAVGYDNLGRAISRAVGRREIKHDYVQLNSDVDKQWSYIIDMNKDVDAQLQHMIEHEQKLIQEKEREAQVTREIQQVQQAQISRGGVSGAELGWSDVNSAGANHRRARQNAAQDVDYLRQQIASLLEISEQEIKTANTQTATYNRLSKYVKQLQSAYNALGADLIAKGEGTDIIETMQRAQRAMQKLQAQAQRPVSLKAALGLDETTLDDIAYKIQMLQRYRSGIDITKPNASKELDSVNKAISELNKKQRELLGTNKSLLESNNALARSWNYMKNRLAFYFTVGASTAFVKNLIEVRSQYEMNERSLGILVDSAARGTRIFNELSQMSLVSPYTLIELSSAAKQLTAYDIAAKDVVDTTRRLADMAAAVGAPIERLTYALGQIKAYGYLNSRDARMFANAGIPLVKQLAEYYSELEGKLVSAADVYDRMKKKAIDFNAVMAVVNKMTDEGGKFFDFQAKMADTLKVRLANLTLAWNNMLNAIGKDTNGILTTSIKGLAELFKHWRSVSRILGTLVTTFGAYKAAVLLSTLRINASLVSNIAALAVSTRNAGFAFAFLGKAMMSVPFAGWVAAIASIVSWFYLFNQSGDDVKQKLQDIQSAFDGVRKEVDDLFADAIRTDSIGTQLTKLQSMLETAETELGIVIPINLEDVNESNIKQKLKKARKLIDTYLNFSQTFSEAAAGSRFNEAMNEFGSNARKVYTGITESINTVVVALRDLSDEGKASKRDIEILNELTAGQKDDESRIEYLQRLISLYEELGLIGKKEYTPNLGISAIWRTYNTNMNELQAQQEQNIERLGIKNKSVFESMLNDVQGYYSSSQGAFSQFEKQIERVAQKIDINNIPVEQRTLRLQVAINEEASLNNWNEFEKEYARQIANQKYGTQIEISSESKNDTEADLQEWQKRQQEWMDNHGIKVKLSFQTDETEASYASRMLQAAKDAQNKLEIQKRKLSVGTGSQEDVDNAIKELNEAIEKARAAGADLSQLDKKKGSSKKDILGDALTKELQLVTDIQKLYKEYTKAGVDSETAKLAAAKEYQKTLEQTNNTLAKFGVQGLTGEQLATMDLRSMRDYYQSILDKVQSSPKAVEALEKAIRNLNAEITKEGQKTIIDSLNSELSKLKDEYELAVELDANPELGGVFADMMGLSKDELEKLPRDFEGVVRKLQNVVDKELGMGVFDVRSNLNKDVLDEWVKSNKYAQDSELVAKLKAITDYANKVRQDETKKQIEDWNKLLEKYAEYEYKRNQILQTYERERKIALEKGATQEVLDSIEQRKDRELAGLDFEQFQKTSTWLTATGDLATLTDRALGLLIDRLEEYKKSAKDLDPKQIKQINNALKSLRREQRQGNPFLAIANAKDAAKEAWDTYQEEIDEYMEKLKKLNELEEKNGELTLEQENTRNDLIGTIARLRKEQEEASKVSAASIVEGLQGMLSPINQVTGGISDMFAALGNDEVSENIKKVTSVLDKAVSFAAIGLQVGGGWGAAIGGVVGLLVGGISALADAISGNASITEQVEESEKRIRSLENAYKVLQKAVDDAYGTAEIGAKKVAIENKKLQLAELERQLQLEQSRSSKYKDEEKISSLKGQIIDLKNEISEMGDEIINSFLGISSIGDAVENFVDIIVDALREGEDAMAGFNDSIDDMIANMLKKFIATRIIGPLFESAWNEVDEYIRQRAETLQIGRGTASQAIANLEKILAETTKEEWEERRGGSRIEGGLSYSSFEEWQKSLQSRIEELRKAQEDAETPTFSDVELLAEKLRALEPILEPIIGDIDLMIERLGLKKSSGEMALSNLQQGISSISEDTAGSIEAYLNGISQQIYLHSSQLEEIKALMQGWNFDVSLGTMSQVLLQLQSSYQVQLTIQNTLLGWSSSNGMSVRVEMV